MVQAGVCAAGEDAVDAGDVERLAPEAQAGGVEMADDRLDAQREAALAEREGEDVWRRSARLSPDQWAVVPMSSELPPPGPFAFAA